MLKRRDSVIYIDMPKADSEGARVLDADEKEQYRDSMSSGMNTVGTMNVIFYALMAVFVVAALLSTKWLFLGCAAVIVVRLAFPFLFNYNIYYDMDEKSSAEWNAAVSSFGEISRSDKVWLVRDGEKELVKESRVLEPYKTTKNGINTNVPICVFRAEHHAFMFMPDCMLSIGPGKDMIHFWNEIDPKVTVTQCPDGENTKDTRPSSSGGSGYEFGDIIIDSGDARIGELIVSDRNKSDHAGNIIAGYIREAADRHIAIKTV
ncbi:MAG: hypothetical protein ACOX6J_05525 [Oscillospiraceae bacterium]|jgi:hypothetical protein